MRQIDISVVICTYNRAEMLSFALESLISQETEGKFCYEILVVDDASTDGTYGVVKEFVMRSKVPIRYVQEEGHGIARARNRGVKESFSEWIAFTDDDQVMEPNWLKELFEFASETGAHCVGGARLLYLSKEDFSQLCPICRGILGEIQHGNKPRKCRRKTYPGTGNVLIKASVFDAIGQFDEALRRGGSDLDFFRRVRMGGIEAWYTSTAVVHHLVPSYRLSEDYLTWKSLIYGANFAEGNYREWGLAKTTLSWLARIGQALLINMPLLFWAYTLGNNAKKLGQKCLLLKALGYTRQTLHLLAPRLFPQKLFFAKLEFRRERKIFPKDSNFSAKDAKRSLTDPLLLRGGEYTK